VFIFLVIIFYFLRHIVEELDKQEMGIKQGSACCRLLHGSFFILLLISAED
jgi:hypothetical protein